MRSIATYLLLLSFILPAASAAERPSRWHTLWHVSQAMLVAGDAADAASSWGKVEGNPLVRSGQRFSYGSLAIKMVALGGGLAAQRYVLHKAPDKAPLFAAANLATAGMLGIVADHNMHVPRP